MGWAIITLLVLILFVLLKLASTLSGICEQSALIAWAAKRGLLSEGDNAPFAKASMEELYEIRRGLETERRRILRPDPDRFPDWRS